jgi:nickel/cobalt transporter (NicO) family protein
VSVADPALLAASAGVAFGHAVLPDHWLPLAVIGRTRRYRLTKIARLSNLAGIAHVLLSIVLGTVIIVIGLQFRRTIENAQDTIIGGLLVATGLGFIVLEITGHGHHHDHEHVYGDGHDHPQGHDHGHGATSAHPDQERDYVDEPHGVRGLAALMVPFGAAASPDLTILPVFLAATTAGVATAVSSVVVFAAVTIGTIVGLTVAAATGTYKLTGDWLERWGNAVTAAVLLLIGTLVLIGLI